MATILSAGERLGADCRQRTAVGTLARNAPAREGSPAMAIKVYLGSASAAHSQITYDEADAFNVTAGGFLVIQRQHSGEQKDLAVFAPGAWLHAEIAPEPIEPRGSA
jgi:hypothetical protein